MHNFFSKKGSSILLKIQGRGRSDRDHLYIFCEGICSSNKAIIVPVQTIRSKYDETTVLIAEQINHNFIKKNSYIAYYEAQVVDVAKIEEKIKNGKIMDNITNNIFLNIKKGILLSKNTPREVKKCFENMKNRRCCNDVKKNDEKSLTGD